MKKADTVKVIDADELDRMMDELAQMPAPEMSADLSERIIADALAEMSATAALPVPEVEAPAPGGGWIQQLLDMIGGVPGVAGLAAAGLAGIMVGYADLGIGDTAAQALGFEIADYDISDLYPGLSGFVEDGS